jgi:predicted nucleic acid-binding protein
MAIYYLEPSALVKYYVAEPGSNWVRTLVDAEENVLVTAEITIAEVSAALGVIARVGRISRRQRDELWGKFKRDLLTRYEVLPTHRTIINRAAELCQKHPLRGFDAIHLASGLQLQETLVQQEKGVIITYVTGDDPLVTAGQTEGLTVDNPFWHTGGSSVLTTGLDISPSP